jgi:hypothetical protein
LDVAAQALIELRSDDASVVTLVHPHPAPYKTLFDAVARDLDLPFASYTEWERRLEDAAEEVARANDATRAAEFAERVPGATLLEFFKGGLLAEGRERDAGSEVMGLPTFETENSQRGSVTLRGVSRLRASDALSWIGYWKSIGFLPA